MTTNPKVQCPVCKRWFLIHKMTHTPQKFVEQLGLFVCRDCKSDLRRQNDTQR